jgi:hypothetical protein
VRLAVKIMIGSFLFLSSAGLCFAAPAVVVRTAVDKKTVTIGENFRYIISVSADKKSDVTLPDLANAFKDLTIVDSGRKTTRFLGRTTITQWTTLQSFTPGTYTILRQEVRYKAKQDKDWKPVLTDSQTITVRSLLNNTTALGDIKGPLDFGTAMPFIVLVTLAGLVLVLIFWKKIFPAKEKIIVEIQPWNAHETAYAQLDALLRKGLLGKGMIKMYYSELSGILRHYLENRFSLKAPEMTTEEFIAYVREYTELGREQKDLLKDFLTNCDLVKFAKYIPPAADGEAAFETVKKFVDQTRSAEADHAAQQPKK